MRPRLSVGSTLFIRRGFFGLSLVMTLASSTTLAQEKVFTSLAPFTAPAAWQQTENQSAPVAELSGELSEEESDEIDTDRDSFTPATTTTERCRLIFESAYSFLDNRETKERHSFPELLLRYGLTDCLELRLGWNFEVGGSQIDPGEFERDSKISYGLKARVTDQRDWMPGSAIILQGFTPTSGEATDTQFVGTYVFGWELPYDCKLDAAIRYGTGSEGGDHFNEWAPSVVLKVAVTEQLNVHAEYFGIFSTDKENEFARQYFSPGVHYLITPDFEVGVRVGWGLTDDAERFFSNVGFGWRF